MSVTSSVPSLDKPEPGVRAIVTHIHKKAAKALSYLTWTAICSFSLQVATAGTILPLADSELFICKFTTCERQNCHMPLVLCNYCAGAFAMGGGLGTAMSRQERERDCGRAFAGHSSLQFRGPHYNTWKTESFQPEGQFSLQAQLYLYQSLPHSF